MICPLIAKIPAAITNTAVSIGKRFPSRLVSCCENAPIESMIGKVPSQKTLIISAPLIGSALAAAIATYVYSQPQGRKVVKRPIKNARRFQLISVSFLTRALRGV